MIDYTARNSVTSSASKSLDGVTYERGGNEHVVDESFIAGSVNISKPHAFLAADVRMIALRSTADLTIKVNSTTSPIWTINLRAGSLFYWSYSDAYFANPFTADSVTWYVTSAIAARLQGRILLV